MLLKTTVWYSRWKRQFGTWQ